MALDLLDLSRRFGRHQAIEQVSLHVRPGDCYGFIGHNGSGKTTTLRIALGLLRPDRGCVLVDGIDAAVHPRRARVLLGGLGDTPRFPQGLSSIAALSALARLQGLSSAEARRDAARVLALVGLTSVAERPFRSLSHGMRQRLGLAQAILGRPRYVILDEPTNGLDPEGIAEMREILRGLHHDGTAVIISSHQLNELSGLCNRVGVLRRGRLIVEEDTRVLLSSDMDRVELVTDDDGRAAQLLRDRGYTVSPAANGLLVTVVGKRAADIVPHLLEGGLDVLSFGRRPPTLEDVYLRYVGDRSEPPVPGTRDAALGAPECAPASIVLQRSDPVAPPPPPAPSFPVLRAAAYELRSVARQPGTLAMLLAPALYAVLAIEFELAAPATQEPLASVTETTAFHAVAFGLAKALPLLALVAGGMASQTIAGEVAQGTLRNLLLRPIGRTRWILGKALATALALTCAHTVLFAAACGAAAHAFDFTGVADITLNGHRFELVPVDELWPLLPQAFTSTIAPLLAFGAIGLAASTIARGAISALAGSLMTLGLLDLGRALARNHRLEHGLPGAYIPSWLGDTSFIGYFERVASGSNSAVFVFADTALSVPAAWSFVAILIAVAMFRRKSVS